MSSNHSEHRLLVVSSRARNKVPIYSSVLPNIHLMEYGYETTTLEDLIEKIVQTLKGTKVASMAMVLHTSERELFICSPGPALVSLRTTINDPSIKEFFTALATKVLDLVIHFF
jgi:hypothetical protein